MQKGKKKELKKLISTENLVKVIFRWGSCERGRDSGGKDLWYMWVSNKEH